MSKQKKLLLLGGSRYLLPVIDRAHKLGIYVITADYLPNNEAHKYSDEYCNVSIIEKEKVLQCAKEHQIDGVMSFACDPGVVTAAFVAEKMRLPFQGSYESVCILQDKGLFRRYLLEHGFNAPHAMSFNNAKDILDYIDYFDWPVIVKPVDSAGSKGVSKVNSPAELTKAIEYAIDHSLSGSYIVEDFIEITGFRSSADPFSIDGKLVYNFYSDQDFDKKANNPFIPDKIIYPSTMSQSHQNYLTSEIERLFSLLNIKTGIYNIEACIGANGKPYIMEISPRGGGNSIALEQQMAYGVDLIDYEVRNAVGLPLREFSAYCCDGIWCNYAIHIRDGNSGIFDSVVIDEKVKKEHLKFLSLSVKEGDLVYPFVGSNDCIGDMFLQFASRDEMDMFMKNVDSWLRVILK